MDHQTIKSWILDDIALNDEERSKLSDHLAECADCATLMKNLEAALQIVRSAPEITAPSNFSKRFSASLATRKREEEKKQARSLTLALTSSAIVVAIGALLIFLPEVSLISLTTGFISTVLSLFDVIGSTVVFLNGYVKNLNPSTLLTAFVIFGSWILLASLTLAFSVWKLAIKKVEK